MKKNLMLTSFALVCILFPLKINAYCSFKTKDQLLKQANNIKSAYVFDESSKTFQIIINNIPNDFAIKDISQDVEHLYSNQEIRLNGYQPGKSYRFNIYTTKDECYRDTLRYIYITLPTYNVNSTSSLCKGLEEYDICQKWGTYIRSQTEFTKEVKKIRSKMEKETKQEENKEEYQGLLGNLTQVFIKYYYIIVPVIILVGILIIYRLNKKEKL